MKEASPGTDRSGTNRPFHLPRLPVEYYQGDAVVHWTMTIDRRRTGWLDKQFHRVFREIMLHAAARQQLLCPVYCLMPDHLHLIWMGLNRNSDQLRAAKFLREHLAPILKPFRLQHQAHDHVLREDERRRSSFENAAEYILENPIRAGLIDESERWPHIGAIVPGYPTFNPLSGDYWRLFWKQYLTRLADDAGDILRPPIE